MKQKDTIPPNGEESAVCVRMTPQTLPRGSVWENPLVEHPGFISWKWENGVLPLPGS